MSRRTVVVASVVVLLPVGLSELSDSEWILDFGPFLDCPSCHRRCSFSSRSRRLGSNSALMSNSLTGAGHVVRIGASTSAPDSKEPRVCTAQIQQIYI